MSEFYVTFDCKDIEHPETGHKYENAEECCCEWEKEFEGAVAEWDDELLGYRVVSRNIDARIATVRFIVRSALTVEEQTARIQQTLFELGDFVIVEGSPPELTA